MDAKDWIEENHAGKVIDRGAFIHFGCGLCGEAAGRSAWLAVESGVVGCYQPSCVLSFRKVTLKTYARMLNGESPPELVIDSSRVGFREKLQGSVEGLPEGFMTLDKGDCMFARKARRYVESRNISVEDAVKLWGLGYTVEDPRSLGRVVIPYRDDVGRVVWWQSRAVSKSQSRWDNPLDVDKDTMIYNRGCIGGTGDLWVFEGAFNVMTLQGLPAVALAGKDLTPHKAALISRHKGRVLMGLDAGAWSLSLTNAAMLSRAGCDAWAVPFRDGDANEIGMEATLALAGQAVKVTQATLPHLLACSVNDGGKSYPPADLSGKPAIDRLW